MHALGKQRSGRIWIAKLGPYLSPVQGVTRGAATGLPLNLKLHRAEARSAGPLHDVGWDERRPKPVGYFCCSTVDLTDDVALEVLSLRSTALILVGNEPEPPA